jgi:hypothetical protein
VLSIRSTACWLSFIIIINNNNNSSSSSSSSAVVVAVTIVVRMVTEVAVVALLSPLTFLTLPDSVPVHSRHSAHNFSVFQ